MSEFVTHVECNDKRAECHDKVYGELKSIAKTVTDISLQQATANGEARGMARQGMLIGGKIKLFFGFIGALAVVIGALWALFSATQHPQLDVVAVAQQIKTDLEPLVQKSVDLAITDKFVPIRNLGTTPNPPPKINP